MSFKPAQEPVEASEKTQRNDGWRNSRYSKIQVSSELKYPSAYAYSKKHRKTVAEWHGPRLCTLRLNSFLHSHKLRRAMRMPGGRGYSRALFVQLSKPHRGKQEASEGHQKGPTTSKHNHPGEDTYQRRHVMNSRSSFPQRC